MKAFSLEAIQAAFESQTAIRLIEDGFIAYSAGRVQSPPVQQFSFPSARGDCCIKSAWMEGSDSFTVKISSGFYDNPAKGLDSNDGLTMLFSAVTGQPLALFEDHGWLTGMRTALAGRIAARLFKPDSVAAIGIFGCGTQARMQMAELCDLTGCRDVIVWGRNEASLAAMRDDAAMLGLDIVTTRVAERVAREANLLVTATPATEPLIKSHWIGPGTRIIAVGADGPGKQELAATLVSRAQNIVVDSIDQCSRYGEVSHAIKAGLLDSRRLTELGALLNGQDAGWQPEDITLVDLTGLGVQDLQIARGVMRALSSAS